MFKFAWVIPLRFLLQVVIFTNGLLSLTPLAIPSSSMTPSPMLLFPSDTTLFYVLISDTNGCNMTDSTLVTVNPLPNFNLGNNTSICLYDSITLQASSGDTYAWTPNYNITDTSIANPQVYNQWILLIS